MYKNSYSRHKEIAFKVRNFPQILATAFALVFLLNGISFAQEADTTKQAGSSGFLKIAKSSLFGGVSGFVVGGAISLLADGDTEKILRQTTASGLLGGFAYATIEVVGGKRPGR